MIQNKIYNYFERNEKLKVLFIFDPMDAIASELHAVSWRDGFRSSNSTVLGSKQNML